MDQKRKRRRPNTRRSVKKFRPDRTEAPVRAPAQEVVYTAPDPISRKKLIMGIATVASIVLALFLACTVFFKVENVKVSGNAKYDNWTVFEASGIEKGDSLLTFGKGKACARIVQKLPYVKIVRIGITLPNTVNIYIEELDVVYAAQDAKDGWWLITSDGRVVEKTSASVAKTKSRLLGFRIDSPVVGENVKALEAAPEENGEEEKPVTITNQDRLNTALSMVSELERREILGQVASVDVTDMGKIVLWYGKLYEVRLGDAGQMEKKLGLMCETIRTREKAGNNQGGMMDISFEIYPGAVGFQPFDAKEQDAVCAAQDSNDGWWLLTAEGVIVKRTSASVAEGKTKILGIRLQSPSSGQGAKVVENELAMDITRTNQVTVTNQDRLDTALAIAQNLEGREFLNRIRSIDVGDLETITLWYSTSYEIKLGDAQELEKKLELMCQTIREREDAGSTEGGVLDVTFKIYPDQVGFAPFE